MKNVSSKLVALAVVIPAVVLSCGKAKDIAGSSPIPVPHSSPVVEAKETDLQGYWVSTCARPSSGLFGLDYARRQVQFKDKNLSVVVASFSTSDCKPESMEKLILLNGAYELAAGSANGGSNLNYTIQTVHIGAIAEQGVSSLNSGNGTCGIQTYGLGAMTDVKDIAGCDYLYTAGIKPFTIIGLTDNRLTFGNYYSSEDIGTTAEKRPSGFAVGEELTKTAEPMIEMEESL